MRRKSSERRPERRHERTALAERPERPERTERTKRTKRTERASSDQAERRAQARAEKRTTRQLGQVRREERRQRRLSQPQPIALGAVERDGWGLAQAPGPVRVLPAPGLLGLDEDARPWGLLELCCLALAFLVPATLSVIAALAIHATLPTGPAPTPARRAAPLEPPAPSLEAAQAPATSDPSPADDLDVSP